MSRLALTQEFCKRIGPNYAGFFSDPRATLIRVNKTVIILEQIMLGSKRKTIFEIKKSQPMYISARLLAKCLKLMQAHIRRLILIVSIYLQYNWNAICGRLLCGWYKFYKNKQIKLECRSKFRFLSLFGIFANLAVATTSQKPNHLA